MAKYLTPEFYAGLQAGKRWLREVKGIEALFKAALEAEDAVAGVERKLDELRAEEAAKVKALADLEAKIVTVTQETNERLALIAGHATAEKQKFDQQVADARVKADKARQQAELVVQECAAREADAFKAAQVAEEQRDAAEKRWAALKREIGV